MGDANILSLSLSLSLSLTHTHSLMWLLCGRSGKVVLWDILKGGVLKAVTDAHLSPIVNIKVPHLYPHDGIASLSY